MPSPLAFEFEDKLKQLQTNHKPLEMRHIETKDNKI